MATQNVNMPNVPNSGNAALTNTFELVHNLSTATVVLSSVILIIAIVGCFASIIGIFTVTMMINANVFWVGCPVSLDMMMYLIASLFPVLSLNFGFIIIYLVNQSVSLIILTGLVIC